jgi:hypothetical protein
LKAAELRLYGTSSIDLSEHKANTILKFLNGSANTRNDVVMALQKFHGKGELAPRFLLEWVVTHHTENIEWIGQDQK